jgi:Flp pilus assembly protein TadB
VIRSVERQLEQLILERSRLARTASFLRRASQTLAAFGLFALALALALSTGVAILTAAALPLLVAVLIALWARHAGRRNRRNDAVLEKLISAVNEQMGYPECSLVVRNGGRRLASGRSRRQSNAQPNRAMELA